MTRLGLAEVHAQLVGGVSCEDLVSNAEVVIGGKLPTYGPGKGINVEKPEGGESSLPLVMPEK